MPRLIDAIPLTLAGVLALVLTLAPATPAGGATTLSVETITWNVIGLDAKVDVGPATYPVGVRICNSGSDPATQTAASFVWTTANAAIELDSSADVAVGTVGPGACVDAYWTVSVVRDAASIGTARGYQVQVTSAEGATAATPTPRELYVQKLIAQERNSVNAITGPTAVTVGDVVSFTLDADTAIAGFEQLQAFLTLPSSIFQLLSVTTTYEKPVGATNDKLYADACGWDDVPTSATYRSCVGPEKFAGGKVGGDLITTFTARVVGAGTATLTAAIYDLSGASFHYNADFSRRPNQLVVIASAPPATTTTTTTPPASENPVATTTPNTTTTSAPAAATTTGLGRTGAPATTAPPSVASVAVTGRSDSQGLSLLGALLVALGLVAVAGTRIGDGPLEVTALERSVHDLRRALHERDGDPAAAQGWLLLDALDHTSRFLREDEPASR